ncbi:10064_t:CDS:2 [Acaulospora morrowiae]|uniref:10064_t:CDS:1 n=1 Tax=Acaulospora morrowiae TaxID=94023 RepID=A0A9N9AVW3_9GLOM|nr:10064_t:CDS:2 [Acaulospora morrowiae]
MINNKRHERHQRGSLTDIRGQPKKLGAGNGNWGVIGDEINTEGLTLHHNFSRSDSDSVHIRIATLEEFSKMRNAVQAR